MGQAGGQAGGRHPRRHLRGRALGCLDRCLRELGSSLECGTHPAPDQRERQAPSPGPRCASRRTGRAGRCALRSSSARPETIAPGRRARGRMEAAGGAKECWDTRGARHAGLETLARRDPARSCARQQSPAAAAARTRPRCHSTAYVCGVPASSAGIAACALLSRLAGQGPPQCTLPMTCERVGKQSDAGRRGLRRGTLHISCPARQRQPVSAAPPAAAVAPAPPQGTAASPAARQPHLLHVVAALHHIQLPRGRPAAWVGGHREQRGAGGSQGSLEDCSGGSRLPAGAGTRRAPPRQGAAGPWPRA